MAKLCPPNKYEAALELLELDPKAGLEELEKLAKKYPSDPSVQHALGVTYYQRGEAGKALLPLERAAKRDRDREARFTLEMQEALMMVYASLGMMRHAARAAEKARSLGSDLPEGIGEIDGDIPAGAKNKDLLTFERARFDILHGDKSSGLRAMRTFAKRFPDYQPALNNLTTGYFVQGDLPRYRESVTHSLERAPQNIHALLNYARLLMIEEGPGAVQALVPRLKDAPTSRAAGLVDGQLAQGQALALVNDDAGIKQALRAWRKENPDEDDPIVTWLEERLAARMGRDGDPDRPYYTLYELMPGVIRRWIRGGGQGEKENQRALKRAESDLRVMPGLLRLLPDYLGYERDALARVLGAIVLESDLPVPGSSTSWSEVLSRVAQEGPGTRTTRLALLQVLQQRGLLEGDEFDFEGLPGGVHTFELELHDESEPGDLSSRELGTLSSALDQMRSGDFGAGRSALEALHVRHPDNPSVVYNLALSELHDPATPKDAGIARLEALTESHPAYLFAKTQLADEALKEDDLERAQALLAWPEGLRRVHVDEYAVYTATLGKLALAEGDKEKAKEMLAMIDDLVGEESTAYQLLGRALKPRSFRLPFGLE